VLRDSADYANPNAGEAHSGFASFISCMTTGSTALWRAIACEMKPNFLGVRSHFSHDIVVAQFPSDGAGEIVDTGCRAENRRPK
jgi:hypothetical protein